MQVIGYLADGSISAIIDGVLWSVPDDLGHSFRRRIAEEWEAEGKAIPAYVAPSAPEFPNLEPDQFWFVVRASGYEPELRAWVARLNDPGTEEAPNSAYDPLMWAAASAKLDFAKFFERDHPLVEAARLAIGMTVAELDDLWRYAAA